MGPEGRESSVALLPRHRCGWPVPVSRPVVSGIEEVAFFGSYGRATRGLCRCAVRKDPGPPWHWGATAGSLSRGRAGLSVCCSRIPLLHVQLLGEGEAQAGDQEGGWGQGQAGR